MAGIRGSAGRLALRLNLRRNRKSAGPLPTPPHGAGALLLIHLPCGPDDPPALAPVIAGLRQSRPDLRLLIIGGAVDTPSDRLSNRVPTDTVQNISAEMLAELAPSGLLVLGNDLPLALIPACAALQIPVILAEARMDTTERTGLWQDMLTRALLSQIDHLLMPDPVAAKLVKSRGGHGSRIEVIGPVTDTRAPLRGNEAERQVMAQLLRDRHLWLAACPTRPEAFAALHIHQQILQYSHRAMLILAGVPHDTLPQLKELADELGLAAILRSDEDDPSADDQILIAEDDEEMGLWYRLAPVCFMGGTLLEGDGLPPRHPFEPAALGSAIIHGPLPGPYGDEWAQLDGAQAARKVMDLPELAQAIEDLSAADEAATSARNAWAVSTGGAAVVRRITATVLTAIGAPK